MFGMTPRQTRIVLALTWAAIWTAFTRFGLHHRPSFLGAVVLAVITYAVAEMFGQIFAHNRQRVELQDAVTRAIEDGDAAILGFGFGPGHTLMVQTNVEPLPERVVVIGMDGAEHEFAPTEEKGQVPST